ncbi:hypothetical protein ACH4E7_21480 [Kitasatospora sp. NPDC018058]|uniref:hypothetical protein n=1 Tax=Kitasatospora sp. NPDC018058 TaxID=3364025 RepID=UPI0037BF554B
MARLMDLDSQGELTTAHVRLVASSLGVTMRAVWYWIATARKEGWLSPRPRARLTVTPEIRRLLAFWGGNVSAVHRELPARAADDPDTEPVLSLSALHRAVVRELPPNVAVWPTSPSRIEAPPPPGRRWRRSCCR